MANYNREILVPYLRDVCSVEMLCQKLERDTESCQYRIKRNRENRNRKTVAEHKPTIWEYLVLPVLCFGAGAFVFFVGLKWLMAEKLLGIILFLPVFCSGAVVCVWKGIKFLYEAPDEYRWAKDKYKKAVEFNNQVERERPILDENVKRNERQLLTLKNNLQNAKQLRQRVYGVNIIPSRYRNVYAAYYLYDYFNTSRETDLDKVVQTLLLDEIKQRLDKIIEQNEEILLNQRYQMALQEKQNTMIACNHREQMQRIARMERNQELQMDYQNMIAQNQNVTNFILTMDYLRKV